MGLPTDGEDEAGGERKGSFVRGNRRKKPVAGTTAILDEQEVRDAAEGAEKVNFFVITI